MRQTFISFDRLPVGSYFDARGRSWVKGPANLCKNGIPFNSYDANATLAANDFDKSLITVELFPGEMFVNYNPNEKRVKWSHDDTKTGE